MNIWYSISILCFFIVIGVLSNYLNRRSVKKQVIRIDNYFSVLESFCKKYYKNGKNSKEATYLIAKADIARNDFGESDYNTPILKLQIALSNNYLPSKELEDIYNQIQSNGIQQAERLRVLYTKFKYRYFNPFTLFYMGVEFTTYIIVGHYWSCKDANYEEMNNNLKAFNQWFSVFSGSASVVSLIWQIIEKY